MLAAKFIVLDGVEGCGKSTQARLLAPALEQRGYQVVLTREPGGTPVGERLRELLLQPGLQMNVLTEALLFCAARAEHLAQVIRPALMDGKLVVCDRFSASTAAYQAYAGGLGVDTFRELDKLTVGATQPDMTFILDFDPMIGMTRKSAGSENVDRIEQKPTERVWAVGEIVHLQDSEGRSDDEEWEVLPRPSGWENSRAVCLQSVRTGDLIAMRPPDYHSKVREGFLQYAGQIGPAAAIIDADQSVEQVHADILRALQIQ